jgi:hypothetical protein
MLDKRLTAEQRFLDRILGLPSGSIAIFQPGYARAALNALAVPAKAPSARRRRNP